MTHHCITLVRAASIFDGEDFVLPGHVAWPLCVCPRVTDPELTALPLRPTALTMARGACNHQDGTVGGHWRSTPDGWWALRVRGHLSDRITIACWTLL